MANTLLFQPGSPAEGTVSVIDRSGVKVVSPIGLMATLGRTSSRGSCDIRVDSPIVSRSHGEFFYVRDHYCYQDVGSANGTYLNGTLLDAQQPVALCNGDVLGFDIPEDGAHHPDYCIALFDTAADRREWNTLALTDEIAEICIGRTGDSGMVLDNEMISERHASFFHSQYGWAVIDHHSTNGTFLNGRKMNTPRYLSMFDAVRVVDTHFIFLGDRLLYCGNVRQDDHQVLPVHREEPAHRNFSVSVPAHVFKKTEKDEPAQAKLVIRIAERSVFQRFKKMTLLKDIDIAIPDRNMVLILGGSGAGKTTFINAVMGYEKAKGTIVYGGTDIYEEYERMKYEIGFVPQQDLLRGSDTVYDTLHNAAQMKLPTSLSQQEMDDRIDQVLTELGLARESETLVSKLSGGQRKRLSIAIEYIANPSLFFLDEPDSGVDDVMGRGLMENLRRIADMGKIVMVITHSPERAADLFDKVIVLAKSTIDNSGHLAFYGSTGEAFEFFGVSSFREIVKKINRKDENGEGLSDYYIEKYNTLSSGW